MPSACCRRSRKLTPAQAMYHFLSGYTARVAGTEKGMGSEPQATFSTCFGAPFLPRHPEVYGKLLESLIAQHGASCWLVNTGWTGGAYGVGKRMSITHTRALLQRRARPANWTRAASAATRSSASPSRNTSPTCRTKCSTPAPPGPTAPPMTPRPPPWSNASRKISPPSPTGSGTTSKPLLSGRRRKVRQGKEALLFQKKKAGRPRKQKDSD